MFLMPPQRFRIWRRAACCQVSTTLIETTKIRFPNHLSKSGRHALYAVLGAGLYSFIIFLTSTVLPVISVTKYIPLVKLLMSISILLLLICCLISSCPFMLLISKADLFINCKLNISTISSPFVGDG
jgi:hypothetical protein